MALSMNRSGAVSNCFAARSCYLSHHMGSWVFCWLIAAAPVERAPEPVLLLRSSSTTIYDQVANGFTAANPRAARVVSATVPQDGKGTIDGGDAPIVVAIGPTAAKYARLNFPTAELVYTMVPDAETIGLVGARVHGVPIHVSAKESLRALNRLIPKAKRVGVAYRKNRLGFIEQAKGAASELGLSLDAREAEGEQDWPTVIKAFGTGIDALWIVADQKLVTKAAFTFVAESAASRQWPLLVFSATMLKSGALVSVEPDWKDVGRRAADIVTALQKGDKVLPDGHASPVIEVNDHVASLLGVTVPPDLKTR